MINKISQHFNKGMNRDISDSKVSNEFAFENHNIRITENHGDTLLSITNEKGNEPIQLYNYNIPNKITYSYDNVDGRPYHVFHAQYNVLSDLYFKARRNGQDVFFAMKAGNNRLVISTTSGISSLNRTWCSLSKEEDINVDSKYIYYISDETLDINYEEVNTTGKYCGHCVVADYLVLFTNDSGTNYIYRINKEGDRFICKTLYTGDLNITEDHPLECIGDYQTENIIKVYWTDGINQPRVINILKSYLTNTEEDPFGFALESKNGYSINGEIDFSKAGTFPSGVIQYFITGINYNNVESSILSKSNLITLRSSDRGLSEDESFNNAIKITINLVDSNFKKYILYSIQHTSVNTEPISRKVTEVDNIIGENTIYDTGDIGSSISATELLYKGSEFITAETIDSKDNTLFLGNIDVKTTKMSNDLITLVKTKSNYTITEDLRKIDFIDVEDNNKDAPQCEPYLRSENYYRIGIQFKDKYGKWSNAFYIDDIQISNRISFVYGGIDCPFLKISINNQSLISKLISEGFVAARSLIVLPGNNDKVVIAQGILNENLINIGDRANGSSDVDSSWFLRPIYPGVGPLQSDMDEFKPYYPLPFANYLNAEIQSQNERDYNESYSNEDRGISQYLIEPLIQDFYSPDIDDTINNESVDIDVVGFCHLDSIKRNTRATVKTPVGVIPEIAEFQNNITGYNVATSFIDGFYTNINLDSLSGVVAYRKKYKLYDVLRNSPQAGLTYAIYPWHRDSSFNNDIAREGRTAVSNYKIFSRYNRFNTFFINNPVSLGTNINFNLFDNNVDQLLISDGTNKYKYRGNLNTIVSPRNYATPIYIGYYNNSKLIYWGERTTEESSRYNEDAIGGHSSQTSSAKYSFSSNVLRNVSDKDIPAYLIKFNKYGIEKLDNSNIYEDTTSDDGFAPDGSSSQIPTDELQTTTNHIATSDPVSIKFKTPNHGVVVLNKIPWNNDYTLNIDQEGAWFAGKRQSQRGNQITIDTVNIESFNGLPLVNIKRHVETSSLFGGKTDYALSNNTWIIGGDEVELNVNDQEDINVVNGDTYFYRWQLLKTYPYATGDKNSVVEIGSFAIESYRNLQGRYDRNQYIDDYTIANSTNFGLYNDVYNQKDNLFTYRYLPDEYLNTNKFPNQFIWTLEHTPGADIDNWTNLSYGSFYNVNGDNGEIRAIRRYGDSLLGFQDSGIFQIMYNSRTQISTTNGLPIELANSGKVDGVRYLTDKEGCVNKWSIKITPNGVYFIDDLNYAINLLQGSSLKRLSEELGFSQWCKDNIIPYKLWTIDNGGFRTYYDRILNDVYFTYGDKSLVYSEKLGQFMTFMDYPSNYAMDNLNDTFISFNNDFWNNRTGEYNSFFGVSRDYFVKYRIAPDPYINKTFNNIEYVVTGNNRTSNYTDLIVEGVNQVGHSDLTLRPILPSFNLQKKFNIWRANIPREDNAILNRIQSPWIYLTLKSDKDKRKTEDKIELHNLLVKYSV